MHTAMHEADAFDFSWPVQYGQHGMSPSSPIAIGTLSTTAGMAVGAAATATDTAIKIAKLVRSADTIIPIFERSALCVNLSGTLNVMRHDADVDREPDPGMCRFREPPGMDMSGSRQNRLCRYFASRSRTTGQVFRMTPARCIHHRALM